ncbi:Hypothetical protein ETEE_3275 [Edwardsiella anguillarum ET080813]|uniref:Uncharacterized protein n=1 Tax=Edwardsiella anguillarum ET080813 TaxID=667120 RepID=A0A076LW26_9GAMM|nr:Hypothetical protein ETEE_3275 [Edwardsiella anguillarum ET080813]
MTLSPPGCGGDDLARVGRHAIYLNINSWRSRAWGIAMRILFFLPAAKNRIAAPTAAGE